ncbi:Single-stranded DNA-binding protein [hydrothermal vent metagenome]|uniref:Single-stranded DNA-binding protein n=1 Tax=hydrothermal vent metagenome TaxID=652676 RepID=A0A3B1C8H5_9ZZZZ
MFNRIILVGNLTKDPELRYTPQGTPVVSMRIAVNSKIKQGNEFKDETLFIDTVVFGKQAENITQYLSKGSGVLVEGRLKERRWEYEGQQKSKFEVIASTVRFLPRKDSSAAYGSGDETPPPEETTELEPF